MASLHLQHQYEKQQLEKELENVTKERIERDRRKEREEGKEKDGWMKELQEKYLLKDMEVKQLQQLIAESYKSVSSSMNALSK